jgi:TolB-like protein
MRMFSLGAVSRAIAHGITVAILCSAALLALGAVPAGAQISTAGGMGSARTSATQSVAVVPFENRSGYRLETFGQEAADAVSTELRDRLNLDVLPKADSEMWLRNLGYKPPFSDQELARLATELEVNMAVTGQVRVARVVQSRDGRYGEVTLAVLLFDRLAQAGTNGALITSRGPASTEASDDTLITKALQQAAFDAVQQMRTRPTVTAMVLWSRDATVFLNVGGRAGVEPGMKMIAVRDSLRIGMVEITEASPVGSYATIVQGPPLRTGDHLRAIYQLPEGAAAAAPRRTQRQRKGAHNLILTAAAILGVAELASTSNGLKEGDTAAPGFQASNLANGIVTGYAIADPAMPAVVVSWIPYSGTEKNRLAGYEVIRNGQLTNVIGGIELLAQNHFIDMSPSVQFTVGITIENPSEASPQFAFTRVTSTGTLGITVANNAITWIFLDGGLQPGFTYYYQIKPVVAYQYKLTTGLYEWRLARDTQFSPPTAKLTAVAPPKTVSVAISGNVATFALYDPIGADEAIVQLARDPDDTFPASRTFEKRAPGMIPGKNSFTVDLVKEFKAKLPGAASNLIWWRIGLRNRSDVTQPRPFPFNLANDYGWVWMGPPTLLPLGSSQTFDASAKHRSRDVNRLGSLGKRRGSSRPGPTGDRVLRAN